MDINFIMISLTAKNTFRYEFLPFFGVGRILMVLVLFLIVRYANLLNYVRSIEYKMLNAPHNPYMKPRLMATFLLFGVL